MRNRFVFAFDLPLIAMAVFGSFVLRFDWYFDEYRQIFLACLLLAVSIKPPVFLVFGLYSRYWRYASTRELGEIVLAVSAASVALAIAISVGIATGNIAGFPRSILIADWLLTLTLVSGLRLAIRVIGEERDHRLRAASGKRVRSVLVVGAGEAGTLFVREMHRNANLGMRPVGFLDDDPIKHRKVIMGVPVLGRLSQFHEVVQRTKPDEVIVAMPTAPGSVIREMTKAIRDSGVVFRTMPAVFELLDGDISVSRLREVDISDLLRREAVRPRSEACGYLAGQVVAVSGAGGSIGRELSRQIAAAEPAALIMIGHGENSIFEAAADLRARHPTLQVTSTIVDTRDEARLTSLLKDFRPSIVFHAAAHKHVSLMEENVPEAITNNVLGTRNMLRAASAAGTQRFVLISTDKAVAPTNVMGASKRVAEMVVRRGTGSGGPITAVVRFGNVLGSRGSVVPIFKRQIERGLPITVTHPDVERYFMTIPEAVHLVVEAGGLAKGGELFCLNMGSPVKIRDLAEDLIRLSGASTQEIPIVFTGLRPGEKLQEQLWEAAAQVTPTENRDVIRIDEPVPALVDIDAEIEALIEDGRRGDDRAVRARLEHLVPSASLQPHTDRSPT